MRVAAAQRGHETVVLDLPRAVDPLVEELVARCDQVYVLTVTTVAGLASAARLCARFADPRPLRLVLRGPRVDAHAVTRLTTIPVAAEMPDQRGLEEAVDLGLGPVRSPRVRSAGQLSVCWHRCLLPRARMTQTADDDLDQHTDDEPAGFGRAVDEVRQRLAERPGELTAHRVAEALREAGRPVGDATVSRGARRAAARRAGRWAA
jgi:hypothetical protein